MPIYKKIIYLERESVFKKGKNVFKTSNVTCKSLPIFRNENHQAKFFSVSYYHHKKNFGNILKEHGSTLVYTLSDTLQSLLGNPEGE